MFDGSWILWLASVELLEPVVQLCLVPDMSNLKNTSYASIAGQAVWSLKPFHSFFLFSSFLTFQFYPVFSFWVIQYSG